MSQQNKNHFSMHSEGTTAFETLLIIFPAVFYAFLTVLLVSFLLNYATKQKKRQFILEFLVLVIPLIVNMTVLADYAKDIIVALFTVVVTFSLLVVKIIPPKLKPGDDNFTTNFLTNARASVSVMTVIAILAVDFRIFPRRFAKTETFGYSLMDAGVGLFIFSNGLLAPEVRGQTDSIKKSIKNSIPLFILGGARFIFVNQTEYNVPISEYGVHWNFFITLAFTKIFSSFILNSINIKYIIVNAVSLVIAHEILLQAGLQKFVLTDIKRDSFVVANKEGLVSCAGYVSIYLFAVYFGYLLDIKRKKHSKTDLAVKFIVGSILSLTLTIILQQFFGVSRRLANSAYCFWIVFICILMLGMYYLAQIVMEYIFKERFANLVFSPLIFESVNYNGLAFFLIGNVLTGLINMSLNTYLVNDFTSLLILVLYMLINCHVVTILYCKQIKLKL